LASNQDLYSLLNKNITLLELLNFLKKSKILKSKADIVSYLSSLLNVNTSEIPLNLQTKLCIDAHILKELKCLKEGYPLSYILKSKYFYGREFYVDRRVLIPRDASEIIIEKMLAINTHAAPLILDLCTGSGCLSITALLEINNSLAIAIDKSLDALKVAKLNVERFGLDERLFLICADVFDIESLFVSNVFDFIICNPPYVGTNDKYETNILFEPKLALFPGDKKGLLFYKKLLPIVNKLCRKGGYIIFEINPFLLKDIFNILIKNEIEFQVAYDSQRKPRIVFWKNI
jgi:release factor glutamine methyltransferase